MTSLQTRGAACGRRKHKHLLGAWLGLASASPRTSLGRAASAGHSRRSRSRGVSWPLVRLLRPSQLTVWLPLSEPQFLHLQYGTITQTWPGAAHTLAPGEEPLCFRGPGSHLDSATLSPHPRPEVVPLEHGAGVPKSPSDTADRPVYAALSNGGAQAGPFWRTRGAGLFTGGAARSLSTLVLRRWG